LGWNFTKFWFSKKHWFSWNQNHEMKFQCWTDQKPEGCHSITVHCPLLIVQFPLSTACPMFTAHCTLSTVHCLMPTVYCPLFTAHCSLPTSYCPWLIVHCPLPPVLCLLPIVHCQLHCACCISAASLVLLAFQQGDCL
jgi:hypothetical protein